MYKVKPVMDVVQSERLAAPYVPEECLKRGMSEELDQIKMFSEELEFPVNHFAGRLNVSFNPQSN